MTKFDYTNQRLARIRSRTSGKYEYVQVSLRKGQSLISCLQQYGQGGWLLVNKTKEILILARLVETANMSSYEDVVTPLPNLDELGL